jgi:hypothetical protein
MDGHLFCHPDWGSSLRTVPAEPRSSIQPRRASLSFRRPSLYFVPRNTNEVYNEARLNDSTVHG